MAPTLIRAEGRAERIGDILITCPAANFTSISNVVVDLIGQEPVVQYPSYVPTPVDVTSRVLGPVGNVSEGLLMVNDLASPPVPGANIYQGIQTGPAEVTFPNVQVPATAGGKTTTLRITNIRINARDFPGTVVSAMITGYSYLPVLDSVAVKTPGLQFTLETAAGSPVSSLSFTAPGGAAAVLTNQLVFAEGYPDSFRKRNTATSMANPSALADQGVPGTNYHTETGFYLSTLPPENGFNTAGLATQGTRLVAHFDNIPAGVSLFVTTAALPNTGASSAQLTNADATGTGTFSPVAATATTMAGGIPVGIAPVTLVNGAGTATWEILDADPAALETYTFGLAVAYASPQAGSATVTGEFGPLNTVPIGDSTSPVPRFADLTNDAADCAVSPCLTAIPSAISIAYQTGTAAPAPINLRVASSLGTLPFNATVQASPAGWLSVSSTGGGVTPSTVQLTITPGNLAAGFFDVPLRSATTYHGSIILTSPTGAFVAVTVPVLVTVTPGPSGVRPMGCVFGDISVTPPAPTEAITTNMGDAALECTGGVPTPAGQPVPTYDVQLTLNAPITSRTYANGWSEALLLIDEPDGGLSGTVNSQLACADPTGSCFITGTGTGVGTYAGTPTRPNVFSGRVSGNTLVFPGVPIDPVGNGGGVADPVAGVHTRILRITNVRADMTAIPPDPLSNISELTGTISVGNIAIENPTAVTAYGHTALSASVRDPNDSAATGATAMGCVSSLPQRAGVLRFATQFGTALLARSSVPFVNTETSPVPQTQNQPGALVTNGSFASMFYNPSLVSPLVDFSTVGLADFGNRLRAQFSGIPVGTRVFVSTLPVVLFAGVPTAVTSGSVGRLVANEMLPFLPLASTTIIEGISAVELTAIRGSASAVWEMLASDTSRNQNIDFLVWVQPAVNTSSPVTFTGTYAPAPPAFADASGHSASPTLPIQRFAARGTAQDLFTVSGCAAPAPAPDLVLTATSGPVAGTAGGAISVSSTVLNQGTADAGPFHIEFYLSPTNNPSGGGTIDLGAGCSVPSLATGTSFVCSVPVTLLPSVAAGTWYVAALADSNNQLNELDETNNWRIADTAPMTVGGTACTLGLSSTTAEIPATGTSNAASCPDASQPTCGFYPETPRSFTVTPSACGTWGAVSSNPEFVSVTSPAVASGVANVNFNVLTNVHTYPRDATITVSSGAATAIYFLHQEGSSDNLEYRQVYALYEQLLGRYPDQGGFTFWTGIGSAGLGQMADSFLTSPEALGTDFAAMVAYQAATGFSPSYSQFASAVAALRSGTQTASGIFASLISANFTVTNLYQNLLGRAPTAGEISGANPVGLPVTFQTIVASNEFQSTGSFRVDHTNGLYIQMLYFVILGRTADPAGYGFWQGVANRGGPGILFQGANGFATRIQILGPGTPNQGFIGSPEFQGLFSN